MPNTKNKEKKADRLELRYKDKTYNELFRKWRRQAGNNVGFYYEDDSDELTYKDGYGFIIHYPEAVEAEALRSVMNIIGMTILLLVGIDVFYNYVLPFVLNALGFDIYLDFFTGKIYGSGWLTTSCYVFFTTLKRAIPFYYCYKKLKMPLRIMVPTKIAKESKPLFYAAVPAAMLSSGVCAAIAIAISEFMRVIHLVPSNWTYMPEEPLPMAFAIIAHVIIVPLASELYIRGPVTQILRQFGDGFAIVVTSLLSMMITYDINHFCYVFVTSAVIGYFAMRTGSVITGIIMRITVRFTACGLYLLDRFTEGEIKFIAMSLFIFVLITFGAAYMIYYMLRHVGKLGMPLRSRYISFASKCGIAMTSPMVSLGLTLTVIMIILHLRFDF